MSLPVLVLSSSGRRCGPYTDGAYVNFLGDEGERRIHEAYPPATYARLAALKKRYDPTNLFHFNQNIPPARTGLLAA